MQRHLDFILGVQDGAAQGLPDVVDHLLPVGDKGRRPELEVSLEGLLAQPADGLGRLARHCEPVTPNSAAHLDMGKANISNHK